MPLLTRAGFLMKHCQMEGMQSRAFWPTASGSTGTLRHARNSSPSLRVTSSNSFMACARRCSFWGKKNMPTPYSRHSANAAGIVLELRVIQAKRRGVFRKLIHCLSHPYLSKYPLGRGTIRSQSCTENKKRPRRADFTLLERLCSGTYNYTER